MHVEVMEVESLGKHTQPTSQTSRIIVEISPEGILTVGPEDLVSPCICSLWKVVGILTSQLSILFDVHFISIALRNHFSFTRAKILSFLCILLATNGLGPPSAAATYLTLNRLVPCSVTGASRLRTLLIYLPLCWGYEPRIPSGEIGRASCRERV